MSVFVFASVISVSYQTLLFYSHQIRIKPPKISLLFAHFLVDKCQKFVFFSLLFYIHSARHKINVRLFCSLSVAYHLCSSFIRCELIELAIDFCLIWGMCVSQCNSAIFRAFLAVRIIQEIILCFHFYCLCLNCF